MGQLLRSVAFIIGIVLLSACSQGVPVKPGQMPGSSQSISATDLYSEFKANPKRFRENRAGKTFTVSGVLADDVLPELPGNEHGTIFASRLKTDTDRTFGEAKIRIYFTQSKERHFSDEFMRWTKRAVAGSAVTVVGTIQVDDSTPLGSPIAINDCRLP